MTREGNQPDIIHILFLSSNLLFVFIYISLWLTILGLAGQVFRQFQMCVHYIHSKNRWFINQICVHLIRSSDLCSSDLSPKIDFRCVFIRFIPKIVGFRFVFIRFRNDFRCVFMVRSMCFWFVLVLGTIFETP